MSYLTYQKDYIKTPPYTQWKIKQKGKNPFFEKQFEFRVKLISLIYENLQYLIDYLLVLCVCGLKCIARNRKLSMYHMFIIIKILDMF